MRDDLGLLGVPFDRYALKLKDMGHCTADPVRGDAENAKDLATLLGPDHLQAQHHKTGRVFSDLNYDTRDGVLHCNRDLGSTRNLKRISSINEHNQSVCILLDLAETSTQGCVGQLVVDEISSRETVAGKKMKPFGRPGSATRSCGQIHHGARLYETAPQRQPDKPHEHNQDKHNCSRCQRRASSGRKTHRSKSRENDMGTHDATRSKHIYAVHGGV
mmetsp:Transcript_72586/g.166449  ORF Transcript_72586/g.166449 Transcript_72586/m.166449 type:complete len:217 (-) Transcript_72586:665-1315(-)